MSDKAPAARVSVIIDHRPKPGLVIGRAFLGVRRFPRPSAATHEARTVTHYGAQPEARLATVDAALKKGRRGRPRGTSYEPQLALMAERVTGGGERKTAVAAEIARGILVGRSKAGRADEAQVKTLTKDLVRLFNGRFGGK